jgi:putative inorganic carbon (hco3(-)) transporter
LLFLLLARGPTRKKAIRVLALGAVALYLLLGDPKILDRFVTTFSGSEERDNSAASRLQYWQAGLAMLNDFPLGAGGGAFKYVYGGVYIKEVTGIDEERSLHNGYLTEATDWGVQGILLKLILIAVALAAAHRTASRCRREGRSEDALIGICVIVSAAGLLVTCIFGSFLNNEWFFWVMALLIRYGELYQVAAMSLQTAGTPAVVATSAPTPTGASLQGACSLKGRRHA